MPDKRKPIKSLTGRCATCLHWQGDKEIAAASFLAAPASMDLFNGWPNDGDCGVDYEFLDITITAGDAAFDKKFNANFGCVYWHASTP